MQEIFNWCLDHWTFTAFCIGIFIQVTPAIKLSPITAIFHFIGNAINGEVLHKVSWLEETINKQRKSIDENEMDRIRWEVLDFANACRNHRRHTKDEFQHIISLNAKYHSLLEKYGGENGVFDAEYSYILELYHNCQINNDFL